MGDDIAIDWKGILRRARRLNRKIKKKLTLETIRTICGIILVLLQTTILFHFLGWL